MCNSSAMVWLFSYSLMLVVGGGGEEKEALYGEMKVRE